MAIPKRIADALEIVREHYGSNVASLLDAYTNTPSIPVSAFANNLTPFEVATAYLHKHHGLSIRDIAKLLRRGQGSVQNAHKNANEKKISITKDDVSPYRIPVSAFHASHLSPAESIIVFLHEEYSLDNITISKLLARDPRNTWKLLQRAKEKQGKRGVK